MNKLKIAVSGSHSTGKSTFINQVLNEVVKNGYKATIVTDIASSCPLPILRHHTVESTLWIATKSVEQEIEAEYKFDIIIVDRPILDCWAYFQWVCRNKYADNNFKLLTLKSLIANWLPSYDFIYQTVVDDSIKIEATKGRDLDPIYRNEIAMEMEKASLLFDIKTKPLTTANTEYEFIALNNFILKYMQ